MKRSIKCVRGASLSNSTADINRKSAAANNQTAPSLFTGLHQLRDCLHYLAIERFRLFTKQWHQPTLLVFIPVIVTTAELRILKEGSYKIIMSLAQEEINLDTISERAENLLIRCPSSLNQIDFKWNKFHSIYGNYDLRKVERGVPVYKRAVNKNESSIKHHFINVFSSTPEYITIVTLDNFEKYLKRAINWISELR
ncbi:hypothetical protein M1316_02925 [Candidatus Parvarchaeota archaeon]|nr:hypothetical protein [Candidatus Parvarchaeota archaeon]